jgi:hypothetical protein
MPLNPLSIFYSVPDRWQLHPSGYLHISWKCDPDAITAINRAGGFGIAGVSVVNFQEVNSYFDRLLSTDPLLTTVVVDSLYQAALSQPKLALNNCWFNFITAMTFKSANHTWNKIPRLQQSEELFDRLIAPTLSIESLLAGFDPQYHPNLLVGLQAWTYKVVRYNSFTNLRSNGSPYFGLSNFGVVSRSSYKLIRMALVGNVTAERVERYLSICKIFKNYLTRSKVGTNKLELNNWQEILVEIKSTSMEISVEELQGIVDRVGNLIRAHASPIIDRYDDPARSISIDRYHHLAETDIDESPQLFGQLFMIIDQFINNLPIEAQKIIALRHQQRLTQTDIATIVAQDQSKISRQLGRDYLALLDLIHSQVPHPDGATAQKNSQSIDAIKQLIEQYFCQNNSSILT